MNLEEIKKEYEILYDWTPGENLDVHSKHDIPERVIVVRHKQSTGTVYKDDVFLFVSYDYPKNEFSLISLQPFSMLISHLLKK